MKKNQKGITLIALVITIIVLLILAGVAISQITGNSSILQKAQNASDETRYAEELSQVQLAVVTAIANSEDGLGTITIGKLQDELAKYGIDRNNVVAEGTGWKVTGYTNSTYSISENGKVTPLTRGDGSAVPTSVATASPTETPTPTYETIASKKTAGTILSQTDITTLQDDNGKLVKIPAKFKIASDSATDREEGVVIEDSNGNQFVWIPVDDILNYTRTWFSGVGAFSNYSEELPTNEKEYTSVDTYGGYYIGRYETGLSGTTLVIKSGVASYIYITKSDSVSRAEGMDTEQGYTSTTTTKLCSSYAWDTALNFIQSHSLYSSYATNSTQGNYSGGLKQTGESTAVCNIYDMGGNLWEWTTESLRGGSYRDDVSIYSAGYRYSGNVRGDDPVGFRVTLYL